VWWLSLTVVIEALLRVDVHLPIDWVIGVVRAAALEGATLFVALLYLLFTWKCRPPDRLEDDQVRLKRRYRFRRCWYWNYMLRRRYDRRRFRHPPPYYSEERLPPFAGLTKEVTLHSLARDGHRLLHLPPPRLDEFVATMEDLTAVVTALGHDFMSLRGNVGDATNVSEIEREKVEHSVQRIRHWERVLQRP
jgi:hypothetical protein